MRQNLSILLIGFFTLFLSCSDPCDNVICVNGDCIEGDCLCDEGWEGINCDQRIDPCLSIDCNNGTCDEGVCNCDEGYEGEFCDTEIRAKYLGIYEGDLSPCIPDLGGGGQIDTSLFGQFAIGTLVVGPGTNVTDVNLMSALAFGEFDVEASVLNPTFNIPDSETVFEDPNGSGFSLTIGASGFGAFQDENTILMNLIITITIQALPIPITTSCEVVFVKT